MCRLSARHKLEMHTDGTHKVMSAAHTRRNTRLRMFHGWSGHTLRQHIRQSQPTGKLNTTHKRALGVQLLPCLLPICRGQLAGAPHVCRFDRNIEVRQGDVEGLDKYDVEHVASHESEANTMVNTAKDLKAGMAQCSPITNEAWLAWLESHHAEFRGQLKHTIARRRSLYNGSLVPRSGLHNIERIRPADDLGGSCMRTVKGADGPFIFVSGATTRLWCCISAGERRHGFVVPPKAAGGCFDFSLDIHMCVETWAKNETVLAMMTAETSPPSLQPVHASGWNQRHHATNAGV